MKEIIDAGLGLDYDDLRLARTIEGWVVAGACLRDRVDAILGPDAADVQQIGSSSVLGLLAKPIVDLAAGIAEHHDLARIQAKLENAGWIYRGDAGEDGGHVFVLETRPWHRIAHLHVVDAHARQWSDYLRLRDLLHRNPDARRAYEAVKVQLVEEFAEDRKQYTKGKSAIVQSLLEEFA